VFKVTKAGYTYGEAVIGTLVSNASNAGQHWVGQDLSIAVPKATNIWIVASWFPPTIIIEDLHMGQSIDLDMYLWTPQNGQPILVPPPDTSGIVGPKPLGLGVWYDFWWGSMLAHPYARAYFDGGVDDAALYFPMGVETISVFGLTNLYPPYRYPKYVGNYTVILTDQNDPGALQQNPVKVTMWVKGVIFKTVKKTADCAGYDGWQALTFSGSRYTTLSATTVDQCGDFSGTGLWPYP